jgi:hypothetical protein
MSERTELYATEAQMREIWANWNNVAGKFVGDAKLWPCIEAIAQVMFRQKAEAQSSPRAGTDARILATKIVLWASEDPMDEIAIVHLAGIHFDAHIPKRESGVEFGIMVRPKL